MSPAYVNDNLYQQTIMYSTFPSGNNHQEASTFTIPTTFFAANTVLQDQQLAPTNPIAFPYLCTQQHPLLVPQLATANQLFQTQSQQTAFATKPHMAYLPTNTQTAPTFLVQPTFYHNTPHTPQPFLFRSFSSSVCPVQSAGCSMNSSHHHLTVDTSRASTTRGNSSSRSRENSPELHNYFQGPQNDRSHKPLSTLGSVPENLTSRPRNFGYRSKQKKIEQTRSWIKNEFDRQGLFAAERELVRGHDTVRVHVKTFDGLTDIKHALNQVQNHKGIQIVRVACPFSKKNKFQKKGYIVYLRVREVEQIPFVLEIFSKYKNLYKNCVVAVPKTNLANASTKKRCPDRIPRAQIAKNESKILTFPSPVLNGILIQQNRSNAVENYGSENYESICNAGTNRTVQTDQNK